MTDLTQRFNTQPDLHQSQMYGDLMRSINWSVEKNKNAQVFIRKLGFFAIAKIQRPGTVDWQWLKELRRRHHTLVTYIEPGLRTEMPKKPGLKVEPLAHSQTSLVDLTLSENDILASFSQKTRYNITRNLRKESLSLRSIKLGEMDKVSGDEFFTLLTEWSKKKNAVSYPQSLLSSVMQVFSNNGYVHCAYDDKGLVGALLILYNGKVATYYTAIANKKGYATFAPTLLTWEAMRVAKKDGITIFDFGGTYDPRYPNMYKHWKGFTKFKEGFNPTPVTYPPTALQLFW